MTPRTRIRAVIFDMDGVLIDAREWHYEALNRALGIFGYHISRYEHLTTYDGLPTRRKLEILTLERGFPSALHAFVNELKQMFTMEIVASRCKPVFQHEYLLSKLQKEGFRLGVASNAIRDSVLTMMERANLLQYMDIVLSNEDVKKAKPDPEIYTRAMESLGVSPLECLIVEDNENGTKAAQASYAHVMTVNSPDDVSYASVKGRIREIEEQET